jgi:hypothetical protein
MKKKNPWKKVAMQYTSKEITQAIQRLRKVSQGNFDHFPAIKKADLVMRYLSAQHNIHNYLNYTTSDGECHG